MSFFFFKVHSLLESKKGMPTSVIIFIISYPSLVLKGTNLFISINENLKIKVLKKIEFIQSYNEYVEFQCMQIYVTFPFYSRVYDCNVYKVISKHTKIVQYINK